MSWASNGFFRNVNILHQLTSSTGANLVAIYQPGTLNPASLRDNVRYSAFITSLRITVDITSIPEILFPDIEPGMTQGEIQASWNALTRAAPRKQLGIYMGHSSQAPIKVAEVSLFNRRPYYTYDLLLYLTDATAFDVASDAEILLGVQNVGFGLLSGEDAVNVIGSAVEEAENTAPSLIINVRGGSSGGGEELEEDVLVDASGNPIVDNEGNFVVI